MISCRALAPLSRASRSKTAAVVLGLSFLTLVSSFGVAGVGGGTYFSLMNFVKHFTCLLCKPAFCIHVYEGTHHKNIGLISTSYYMLVDFHTLHEGWQIGTGWKNRSKSELIGLDACFLHLVKECQCLHVIKSMFCITCNHESPRAHISLRHLIENFVSVHHIFALDICIDKGIS